MVVDRDRMCESWDGLKNLAVRAVDSRNTPSFLDFLDCPTVFAHVRLQ